VKLTATASIVTTQKWTPPAAVETTAVTSAPASPSGSGASEEKLAALPLGPIPELNDEASSLVGPGSAADLFPAISPSPAPSPAASVRPGGRTEAPARNASADSTGIPRLTVQVTTLVVLALVILLAVMHLYLPKRAGPKDPKG
jgi:hypothetical protein